MLTRGYALAGWLAKPLLPLLLKRRAGKGKEDPRRVGERYGIASAPRPEGTVVWVHAASVGETNAAMPLVARLVGDGAAVLFTTVSVTGAETALRRLPPGAIHQFSTFDIGPWVDRFLRHWRPNLSIFVESEIWPATLSRLSRAGIPRVVVNGRVSERSYRRWRRLGPIARAIFGRISLGLAQSTTDADRLRALGAADVAVTGNLKFDVPDLPADALALGALAQALGGRPVWLAASTHKGEEEIVANAHRLLKRARPDVLTIIAPRHPKRGEAIAGQLGEAGLCVARRSAADAIAPTTDIYLADTLGELGLLYRLAPVAFLGGSLVPRGGQNPIEAVRLNSAVLHGPHVGNFADVYAALDTGGGARPVADSAELAVAVAAMLAPDDSRRGAVAAAERALEPFSGALGRTLAALQPYLQANRPAGNGAAETAPAAGLPNR